MIPEIQSRVTKRIEDEMVKRWTGKGCQDGLFLPDTVRAIAQAPA